MSMPESCNARVAKFTELFMPVRSTPAIAQRVQGFITARTGGKKLHEFLENGATEEAKLGLLDELNSILETKDYERLPKEPRGQAAPTGTVPAAETPKEEPTVTFVKRPLIPVRTADGGTGYQLGAPKEETVPADPAPTVAKPVLVSTPSVTPETRRHPDAVAAVDTPAPGSVPPAADPAAALAALIRQMIPAPPPPPPAAPSLTEEQVKAIVRTVLADTLEVLVGALRGAK